MNRTSLEAMISIVAKENPTISSSKDVASKIATTFNVICTKEDVDLFFASIATEDYELEARKLLNYDNKYRY